MTIEQILQKNIEECNNKIKEEVKNKNGKAREVWENLKSVYQTMLEKEKM